MNGINGADLDRHITGNYGEDFFTSSVICEECAANGHGCRVLCNTCDTPLEFVHGDCIHFSAGYCECPTADLWGAPVEPWEDAEECRCYEEG